MYIRQNHPFTKRIRLFAYNWKLPAYSEAFLLTVDKFSFLAYNSSFFAYNFSSSTYSWSFFAYSGEVRLIRALRDCKQRSLSVSKKAPTVSEKEPPFAKPPFCSLAKWFQALGLMGIGHPCTALVVRSWVSKSGCFKRGCLQFLCCEASGWKSCLSSSRERANRALVIVLQSRQFLRLRNP